MKRIAFVIAIQLVAAAVSIVNVVHFRLTNSAGSVAGGDRLRGACDVGCGRRP